jgi:hypothetical protein
MAEDKYTLHRMPINDINHAWVEHRTYATEDGVGSFDVYIGKCECGAKFEGKDGGDVARQYVAHVDAAEGSV